MLLYAITTFLSAFLLFQVQPLIAKLILPWFGGSSAVWSASLMFFQVFLLLGYCYAHLLVRFAKPRVQTTIHFGLLLASLLVLPITPDASWKPAGTGNPTIQIVLLLTATVGAPYVLLSATCPLLQVWYARRTGSSVPQRLFALSNAGSLLALLSYPFLVEPNLASTTQGYTWTGFYAVFILICGYTARLSEDRTKVRAGAPAEPLTPVASLPDRPSRGQRILWVALAACASTLLVAVTNHLSTNVAPMPLLWVGPLAIYLITFMFAFHSDRFYWPELYALVALPTLALMGYATYLEDGNLHLHYAMPAALIGLFVACMLCHGEIARRRPATQYLTGLYLLVALGGALGGVFVALISPMVFATQVELPLAIVATSLLAVVVFWNLSIPRFGAWPVRAPLMLGLVLLIGYLSQKELADRSRYLLIERNFYSTLRVRDLNLGTDRATRQLMHGTISHGSQRLTEEDRGAAIAYYAPSSGVGRAIEELQSRGPVNYGVIGLGAGVMSGYARPEDSLRVYETNPKVSQIARSEFSFYRDSLADKEILLGDARLTLESQPAQDFDLLVVDAFSSDSIPVHLLTHEALELYFRHLKPNGVLAMHISNRYLNLVPVVARAAEHVSRAARVIEDTGDTHYIVYPTTWVLITADASFFQGDRFRGAAMQRATAADDFAGWTDDFSSLWPMVSF